MRVSHLAKNRTLFPLTLAVLFLITSAAWTKADADTPIAVSATYWQTYALKSDGTLWAWGYNGMGQLGQGVGDKANRPSPSKVPGTWKAIANGIGENHFGAIKADGTLWMWGLNSQGQLGNGSVNDSQIPVQVGSFNDWVAVAVGNSHTVALRSNGALYTWGAGWNGRIGDGTTNDRHTPYQVAGTWSAIGAGFGQTMALKPDGTLWAWGYNPSGEVGIGTSACDPVSCVCNMNNTDVLLPAQVSGTGWVNFSIGTSHTLALKGDGSLWVWGAEDYGELGDSQQTYCGFRNSPYKQPSGTWLSASAGGNHSLAIQSAHDLWVWGYNDSGQLGLGNYGPGTNWYAPKLNNYASTWWTVSAGGQHSAGLMTDGTLYTWGDNYFGQLGNNAALADGPTPVLIFNLDATPPSVSAAAPIATNVPVNTTISFTLQDNLSGLNEGSIHPCVSPRGLPACLKGTLQNTPSNGGKTYNVIFTLDSVLQYGLWYDVTIDASDTAGNAMSAYTFSFQTAAPPDTTKPTVWTSTSPSGISPLNGSFTFLASDSESGLASIGNAQYRYQIKGGAWNNWTSIIPSGSTASSVTYQPQLSYNETIEFQVSATDVVGNTQTQTFQFTTTTDLDPPTLSLLAPPSGVAPTNATVKVQATDTVSGFASFGAAKYRVKIGSGAWGNPTDISPSSASGNTISYKPVLDYNETVEFIVQATDVAGNTGTQTLSFTTQSDTSAPSASLTSLAGTTSNLQTNIDLKVTDNESGVDPNDPTHPANVTVTVQSVPASTPSGTRSPVAINGYSCSGSGASCTVTVDPSSDLPNNSIIYVTVAATDRAGNRGSTELSFVTQSAVSPPPVNDVGDGISSTWKGTLGLDAGKRTLFIKPLYKADSSSTPVYWSDFKTKYHAAIEGYFNTEFEARARRDDGTAVGLQIRIIGDDANPYAPMRALDYDPTKDSLYCPLVNGQHQCATNTSPPVTILTIEAHENYDVSGTQNSGHTQLKSVTQPDPQLPFELGNATSGGATTLSDTTKSWTANGWVNKYIIITSGLGAGQARLITANTATALTVSPAWAISPDNTSAYYVGSTISYYTWSWQAKGYTTSTGSTPPATSTAPPRTAYNGPAQAGLRALNYYMTEGAYTGLTNGSSACTINCWSPACCLVTNVSTNDFIDSNNNPTDKVAFNTFTMNSSNGAITSAPKFSAIGYGSDAVLTHTLIHEIIHALLTAQDADHCENPCCPMHSGVSRERGWTITALGSSTCEIAYKDGTKSNFANRRCTHNDGGLNDITHKGVVYNASH
jgi:alpha-tubulin suppressor-like RCC1 family protein